MRRAALFPVLCCLALLGGASHAQDVAPPARPVSASALLTLDDELLFNGSLFGKALISHHESETQKLTAENRQIEAGLAAEEQELTTRRATISREEFAALANAFNIKVEGIRAAQEAKSRDLTRLLEEERVRFLEAVRPILAEIMSRRRAVAIIDKRAVFVGFENIDITAEAIAQLDAAIAEGKLTTPNP